MTRIASRIVSGFLLLTALAPFAAADLTVGGTMYLTGTQWTRTLTLA